MGTDESKGTHVQYGSEEGSIDRTHTADDGERSQIFGSDGQHSRLRNTRLIMVLVGFGMSFVGSQIQPLLFAPIFPLVSSSFNASNLLFWFTCTQQIATGVVAPFAGSLADLFGRKSITLAGILSAMVGMILCAASPSAGGYLAGQVFNGIGIAVQELMAIAAIAEIVPTRYRGYYIAAVVASFLPFAPGSLYGALIAQHNWRYCACMIAIWNLLTVGMIWWFYNPPPRTNTAGLSKIEKVKRIDFIGGLIMTAGLVFLLISLNWGGQQYPWNEAKVIAFLTLGIALLILFFVYEKFFATYPMFPSTLLRYPRTFTALMMVILLAGINYVALLVFWVLEAVSVFDSNQFELGVRTMPYGFCIVGGAIISAILISAFKGHLRFIMTGFCVFQVSPLTQAGIGCMAAIRTSDISTVWAPLIFSLLGIGGVLVPNQIIVTIICPDDLLATATCLTACLRAVGQVIGTSIFFNQFTSALVANTYSHVVPAAIEAKFYQFDVIAPMMETLVTTPWKEWVVTVKDTVTPEQATILHTAVVEAFKFAFERVWYISVGFGVAAVLASVLIEDLGALMDGHVAVRYL
ncbi:major facilitator superfamily domain-containing protein [Aspergillus foveolatus]|uniref:major facilitator superfamily domain-containing protein n=1 Tax=Aspergillus foveolatus TaxID=210207 RepID=UPI003CCD847E